MTVAGIPIFSQSTVHKTYLPQYWARNYKFTSNLLAQLKNGYIYFFFHFGPFWSVQLGLGLCQFSIQFLLIQSRIWHLLVLSCPYSSCEKGIYADMHIFKKIDIHKWNFLYYNMEKRKLSNFMVMVWRTSYVNVVLCSKVQIFWERHKFEKKIHL